jgi:hypothetical protein
MSAPPGGKVQGGTEVNGPLLVQLIGNGMAPSGPRPSTTRD